jgi:hypothetical protein
VDVADNDEYEHSYQEEEQGENMAFVLYPPHQPIR